MKFIVFFQLFICFSHLWGIPYVIHGRNYSLECLNDYLFTIRCELNMTSEPWPCNALYWLEFYDEREPFECVLTSQTYPWVCVLNLSTRVVYTFMDTDIFQISLNYSFHGNNGSEILNTGYKPVNYIRPVPPSNLTLLWKPDKAVFHWLSGYKEGIMLVPKLHYQLSIHRNGKVLNFSSTQTNVSVPMSTFAPNTDYTAQVRSVPGQVYYKGVWSHWGPAIYWTTGPTNKTDTPDMSLATVWLALFLLPLILLCYFLYTRWKRCVLSPSPAPHIGDFKCSAMVPENVGELLQREESLQIDSLTEEPNPAQLEKMSNTSFTSSPRSPRMFQSSVDSKVSMSSWAQTLISTEKGSVTYSDDYCTLSHTI